jgi:hypothetical protein
VDILVPVLAVPVLAVEVPVNWVTLGEMVVLRRAEVATGTLRELKREFVVVAPVEVATVYVDSMTKYAE